MRLVKTCKTAGALRASTHSDCPAPARPALVPSDIFRAINSLVDPDENASRAVDARQEIDLRIGAAFTRLQTLLLQNKFDWRALLQGGRDRMLLSYGPCQFPTLGLIVQRLWCVCVEGGEQTHSVAQGLSRVAQPPSPCRPFQYTP